MQRTESGIWIHFENYRRRRIQMLLRTRKQYPPGPIETGVHQKWLHKARRYSQQNWRNQVVYWRKNEHKREALQINKPNPFCSSSQTHSHGVQERSLAQTSFEKKYNQMSHVWKKIQDNHITINCATFVRLLSNCMALDDWKKNFQNRSIFSSIKWMDWASIDFKESTWSIFLLLKIY